MMAAKAKKKKTRFKTLENAERRIRLLERRLEEYDAICVRLKQERIQLAKLAATGPTFFNPLEAFAAQELRDNLLKQLGMHPDGAFIKGAPL